MSVLLVSLWTAKFRESRVCVWLINYLPAWSCSLRQNRDGDHRNLALSRPPVHYSRVKDTTPMFVPHAVEDDRHDRQGGQQSGTNGANHPEKI